MASGPLIHSQKNPDEGGHRVTTNQPFKRTVNMSMNGIPIGLEKDVSYPTFQVKLTLLSTEQLKSEIKEGRFARVEIVDIQVVPIGNSIFAVSTIARDRAAFTNGYNVNDCTALFAARAA
jgi:hypothetical protein